MLTKPLIKKLLLDLPNLAVIHTGNLENGYSISNENLKLLAIRTAGFQLLTALQMLYNEHNTRHKPVELTDDAAMPDTLFHWSIEALLGRCTGTMVWMELLLLEMTRDELEDYKMTIDLQQLFKYTQELFSAYLQEQPLDGMFRSFAKCEATMAFKNWISVERESTIQSLLEPIVGIFMSNFDPEKKNRLIVQRKTLDLLELFTNPLVGRYVTQYCTAKEAVTEHDIEYIKDKKLKEIDEVFERMKRELNVAEIKQLTYYNEIGSYKQQISAWTRKYYDEFESVMSVQFDLQRKLEHLEEQREVYNDNLKMYRRRLTEHYEQEEKQRQLELARLQTLAEETARLSVVSAKKSPRKGGKGKKGVKVVKVGKDGKVKKVEKVEKAEKDEPQAAPFDLAAFTPKTPTIADKEAELKRAERTEVLRKMKEAKAEAEQMKEELAKSKKYKPSKSSSKGQNKKELEQKGKMINKIIKKNSDK